MFAARLTEISASIAGAPLTLTFRLVLDAQRRGEPVAWIGRKDAPFYPPDAADAGVDLAALAVVWTKDAITAAKAADLLVRSGAFGLVVLDLGGEARLPMHATSRLAMLARQHDAAIVCLTDKDAARPSLGPLVSLRAHAASRIARRGGRFRCEAHRLEGQARGQRPGTSRRCVVDRTACIDLPAFPLQLLLRKHPDWREHPAAVVEADTPQGTILWINEKARAAGIATGMRYAAGLSFAAGLRAAVVTAEDIDDEIAQLAELLRRFTPVGRARQGRARRLLARRAGARAPVRLAFRVGRDGARRARPRRVRRVARRRLRPLRRVRRRQGQIEPATAGTLLLIFAQTSGIPGGACREKKGSVPFSVVFDRRRRSGPRRAKSGSTGWRFPPAARDTLLKLGVTTVGQFVDLPLDGVGVRFGPEVRRLHRLASGALDAAARTPSIPTFPRCGG